MNFKNNFVPRSIFKQPDSLQTVCLKCISQNLDCHILAGSETVDDVRQKYVQMLERFYSSPLLKMLSMSRYVQDSHLKFLVNKYLTEIEFEYLRRYSRDALIHRFAEVGYVFQKVNFCHNHVLDETLKHTIDFVNQTVRHLTNVTVLRLHRYCNDATLTVVANSCPKLEELYIDDSLLAIEGLCSSLLKKISNVFEAKCSNLRILSLSDSGADYAVVFFFKHIHTLEEVYNFRGLTKLLCNLIRRSSHSGNMTKFNLTTLEMNTDYFNYIPMEDVSLIPILCPQLKTLTTSCETESDVEALSCFAGIENLTILLHTIYPTSGNILNYNHILKTIGCVLKKLHLETSSFSVSVLIQNCTNLERLHLIRPEFQLMGDDKNTAVMSKLVELRLETLGPFDDALKQSLSQIADSCPNLERLYLKDWYFIHSATLLTFLKKSCPNFLSLKECGIYIDLLEDIIKTTPSLQTLCIVDCGFNRKSIQHLGEISKSLDHFVNICWDEDDDCYQ